ncbi:MAG TPA: biopolymer transporter ExbD [Isosphaeraceae bacterium]|nr:biopolymer transporter ExbD [Isosphaeraceae bacterium]
MKLTSRRQIRGNRIELSMTSMIDVIFLLLIFFMLNVRFRLAERNLESGLQTRSTQAAPSHLEPVIVEFARVASGDYVYKLGAREITTAAELTRVLQALGPSDQAFVKTRDDAPFSMVAAAIQSCYDAGYLSIAYVPDTAGP